MNQTNNRIREEWRKKFHNLVGGTIVNKGKLLDTWSPSFTLEEMEDFIAELLKSQREVYKDALIWCSGSEDFQIEGKAREGWEKICLPLIKE